MERKESANDVIRTMQRMERRFKRVCRQLVLMNNDIRTTMVRYKRAVKDNRKSFRYTLRLRIMTLEGVSNAYREYAQDRADQLDEMEKDLKEKYDIDWSDVCDDDDEGDDDVLMD